MIQKSRRRILSFVLAGLFLVVPAVFAKGEGPSPRGRNKVENRQERRELRYQRRRIKQNRQRLRAEARQNGHSTPPKVKRHQVRKIQRHSRSQNPNLRRARKQNRSRTAHRHIKLNRS